MNVIKEVKSMGNKWITFLIFSCSIVILSCGQDSRLSIPDYVGWINNSENGLKSVKELNDYRFELFYKPVEYIAINEQRTFGIDPVLYSKRLKELDGLQYYTLRIESLIGKEMMRTGIHSEHEYSMRLQYFSDLAQYDMKLVDGNDTLTCALFHFERNYGVAPYNNIVLGFQKIKGSVNSKTLTFNERVLGIGKVNLKIEDKDINNIPQLILN